MAIPSFNITGYLTVIDLCDTGTGWTITDVDTDIKVEGIGAGFDAIRDGGTIGYTFGTAQDMSGTDIHIRQWLMHTFPSYLETKAIGGIQLYITDGTNTAYWYVGGSDTHNGAWQLFQADLSATPDAGTLPTLTAITEFGFVLVHATSARNVANTYWDICTYCKGYEIYGGTSGDMITWLTLATADTGTTASKQYAVVDLVKGGALYLNSGLFIGDSISTNDTYFDGTNQVIIFYDADEKTGLYKIVGTGNATGTTSIDLSGSVIKSASSPFLLDVSGTNVSDFTMNGAKVENASACIFKTGQGIDGTVFTDAGTFTIGGSNFDNNTVNLSGLITVTSVGSFSKNLINLSTTAVSVSCVSSDYLDDCSFVSDGSNHAVDLGTISANTSMSWNCMTTDYAVTNGSTGNEVILVSVDNGITLTINVAVGYTSPTYYNTGTGTVVIVSSVTLTVGGVRSASDIYIYKTSDKSLLASADPVSVTDGSPINGVQYYKLDYAYDTALSGTDVQVKVFNLGYQNERIDYVLTSGDARIGIQQRIDRNYNNPA